MDKGTLIREIYKKTGFPQKDIELIINSMLQGIKEGVRKEGRVVLKGFGVFKAKKRKPRVGRNPRTREEVKIPERYIVIFKPSRDWKILDWKILKEET